MIAIADGRTDPYLRRGCKHTDLIADRCVFCGSIVFEGVYRTPRIPTVAGINNTMPIAPRGGDLPDPWLKPVPIEGTCKNGHEGQRMKNSHGSWCKECKNARKRKVVPDA